MVLEYYRNISLFHLELYSANTVYNDWVLISSYAERLGSVMFKLQVKRFGYGFREWIYSIFCLETHGHLCILYLCYLSHF